MENKTIAGIGALLCALAVILGAFGAHSLEEILEINGKTETYRTAVIYHIFHALAILILALIDSQFTLKRTNLIFWLFFIGLILFSGSLYVLSITGINKLGIITPFGGVFLISAWLLMTLELFKK